MTKHPHAELMAQYAQDALETDKPWERWQAKTTSPRDSWTDLEGHPDWRLGWEYRRKPPTEPRAHADLATLYFSDSEMKCWIWDEFGGKWQELDDPSFSPEFIYHVGKTAPAEPPQIMCELAGVKFPMPVQTELKYGSTYYVADASDPQNPIGNIWDDCNIDLAYVDNRAVQITEKGAIQQGLAMQAALKQAVEKAKEQIE